MRAVAVACVLCVVTLVSAAYVDCPEGKGNLWVSPDRVAACVDEYQAHGQPGPLCQAAKIGTLRNGTVIRLLASGRGVFAEKFDQVEVIDPPLVGARGYLEHACFRDGLPPKKAAPPKPKGKK